MALAAAGAAGLFAPGCPSGRRRGGGTADAPLPIVAGRIHGQDAGLGHLLRSGALDAVRPSETRDVDVLVVGAGVAGLSCAWRLRRADPELASEVLVVDLGAEAGGNARSGKNEVTAFPWGAHYLRAPTREHRSLEVFLEDVGLIRGRDADGQIDWDTRAVCVAPHERLYDGGLWAEGLFPARAAPESVAQLEAFDARIEALAARRGADGLRAFAIPLALSSRDPDLLALDRIPFAEWLDAEGFTDPVLRWTVEYACRDDYGCTLQTASAWAGLHYFAARRGASPDRDAVFAWPEGNGRLVALLASERGGVRFEGRSLVTRLRPGALGEPSEAHVYRAESGDAESGTLVRVRAKHLVYAGSQFLLPRLLGSDADRSAFTYAPWLVANVTLDELPAGIGFPLAWDNVFYGRSSLGYVVANRDAGDGPCVVTWYLPLTGADPAAERRRLLALDHAGVASLVLDDLLSVHPTLRDKVRSVDAWRWGHAMIRPVPGFIWGPARAAALTRDDALLCANADLSGISIFEEAFYRGVVAAEEVLRRRGSEFNSLLG